jgi:predicted acyltransferase (DUF342 family)
MAGTANIAVPFTGSSFVKTGITALAGGAAPTLEANTISGRFNVVGTCATTGDSVILPAGMPQGSEISVVNTVATVTVDVYPPTGGTINGNITATEKVQLLAPAVVTGSIKAPIIMIEAGVRFNGQCEMKGEPRVTSAIELEEQMAIAAND